MSQSDSFIEEVTEEVRRDRLVGLARRYGWVAALVVVAIIGAVAFTEWRQAQARAAAQATGDAMLAALELGDAEQSAAALARIERAGEAAIVVTYLQAAELAEAGDIAAAAAALEAAANDTGVPLIYRQIASFKALTLQSGSLDTAARRTGFEALAAPGAPLRLLAEEQLALLDIEDGQPQGAIARLNALLQDAEATPDLQQRALQVIVALGGEPELGALGPAGTGQAGPGN